MGACFHPFAAKENHSHLTRGWPPVAGARAHESRPRRITLRMCSSVWNFAPAFLARSCKSRSKCWFGFLLRLRKRYSESLRVRQCAKFMKTLATATPLLAKMRLGLSSEAATVVRNQHDKQFHSRDVKTLVGCEKHHSPRALGRSAEPAERNIVGKQTAIDQQFGSRDVPTVARGKKYRGLGNLMGRMPPASGEVLQRPEISALFRAASRDAPARMRANSSPPNRQATSCPRDR